MCRNTFDLPGLQAAAPERRERPHRTGAVEPSATVVSPNPTLRPFAVGRIISIMFEQVNRRTIMRCAGLTMSRALVHAASKPRIAVVGAGAFGGWTALSLLRSGAAVTLIDAWGPGNSRASSGGETRVIRATYGSKGQYT